MTVESAWRRIGMGRPAVPDGDALVAAHRAFALSVPSEDYDIHLGVPIDLRVPALVDKIVGRNRGGYCYELNGLFAALLGSAGFAVTMQSAFTLDDDGARGPEFDHMRLAVRGTDGTWIADVGDGGRWLVPVPMTPGVHGTVRVRHEDGLWHTDLLSSDGRWERDWAWTTPGRRLSDFTERSRFHERDPGSYFRARRFAVLPTEGGRLSLLNGVLSETVAGRRTDRHLDAEQERTVLADRFGIRF